MPQTAIVNRRIVLASRPQGAPTAEHFRIELGDVPKTGAGQVLLRTLYLSLDPYMRGRLPGHLKAACPEGIDVYFENVGGAVFDAVLPLLNTKARVPVCGLVAAHNATELPTGPDRLGLLMGTLLSKRIKMQGFIVFDDYGPRWKEFAGATSAWVLDGKVKVREDIVFGLENAPEAFIGLLQGRNFGKLVIQLAHE
jgi:NADPH-dependent curcumin reductase CurA